MNSEARCPVAVVGDAEHVTQELPNLVVGGSESSKAAPALRRPDWVRFLAGNRAFIGTGRVGEEATVRRSVAPAQAAGHRHPLRHDDAEVVQVMMVSSR